MSTVFLWTTTACSQFTLVHLCVALEAAKNGPIYDVAWSPNSSEFCVVFGFMPAKATVYNLKCDPVFDFGTGSRNAVYYR